MDQPEEDVEMHLVNEMTDVQDGEDMTILEVHNIAGQQTWGIGEGWNGEIKYGMCGTLSMSKNWKRMQQNGA